ncbi:unnamed protein product [Lymnaea stagnalis]|uniref:Uncharacterized protein n=1 Tax=Lymnaea stagnalis TaxID=6523 RepID=A0AAV2IHU6_LYMST
MAKIQRRRSQNTAQRMPSTFRRFNRLLTLRNAVILGIITLVFTFLMLIFSGDLHNYDRHDLRITKGSQDRPKSKHLVENLIVQEDDGEAIQYYKDTRPPMSVARIAKYCNPPSGQTMGEEGLIPSDYKLLNVHVVIRHGDRSPIGRLQGGKSGDLSCLLDVSHYPHLPKVNNFVHIMAGAAKERSKDNVFNR